MLRFGVLAFTLALTTALAVPKVAHADDLGFSGCNAKPTKSDTAEAKRTYERGKRLFDERDRGAIDLFRSAYLADCTKHELLALLSFAYQSDGQLKQALAAAELYLQKVRGTLAADERATVEDRIAQLKQKIKDQEEEAAAAAKPPKPEIVAPPPAAETSPRSPYPWVLVGIGGAGLVAGAILLPVGYSIIPDNCTNSGLFKLGTCTPQSSETEEQYRSRRSKAAVAVGVKRGGFFSLIGGGALVVGGLIWYAIDVTSKPAAVGSVRLVPTFGTNQVGVAGTF